jgi:hypothetical protein
VNKRKVMEVLPELWKTDGRKIGGHNKIPEVAIKHAVR